MKFDLLPFRARPPPKIIGYYLDHTKAGYLAPEIQIRNLKLFGALTSEERLRQEHQQIQVARITNTTAARKAAISQMES